MRVTGYLVGDIELASILRQPTDSLRAVRVLELQQPAVELP